MNKNLAISMAVLIFFGGMGYYGHEIFNNSNKNISFQSSLNRKEMYPLDSLKYKFL